MRIAIRAAFDAIRMTQSRLRVIHATCIGDPCSQDERRRAGPTRHIGF